MSNHHVLTEGEFLERVLAAMPVDLGPVSLATRLDQLPHDKVARAALHRGLDKTLGGPPAALLSSIETLGEAYDWYVARTEAGAETEATAQIRMRPLESEDVPQLYRAATDPSGSFRWRYRGSTPSFSQFSSQLFEGVLAQFMIVDATNNTHGLVCCYNAHLDNKFAYLAILRTGQSLGKGEMMSGVVQFIQYLFSNWDFRKLYAEVPEFNAAGMFSPESRAVRTEGRLSGHIYHDGRWWDQIIIALWREDWVVEAPNWR